VTFDEIRESYDEQCTALEQQGYVPKFVSLTPTTYWDLLRDARIGPTGDERSRSSSNEGVWFRGKTVVVCPYQVKPVVALADCFNETFDRLALAQVRRGLWIKRLRKEIEIQQKAANCFTQEKED